MPKMVDRQSPLLFAGRATTAQQFGHKIAPHARLSPA